MNNGYSHDEQQLIEEVIYLHSLWHQGPPPTPNYPNLIPPFPIPIPIHVPYSEPYLPQLFPNPNPTLFHHPPPHHHPFAPAHTRSFPFPSHTPTPTNKRKKNKKRNKNNKRIRDNPDSRPDPGIEWPCPPSPAPSPKGWAPLKPQSAAPLSLSLSPQEQEKLSALRSQNKASQAIRNFLINDSDSDDEDEDEDDYDLEEIEDLIVGIFMEDDEMRGYYQKCYESGEFCCFVCGAIGKKKSGKKYKDCNSLVQHSMSISRTVKKTAHRAFGQAVCKVLGWDIDRLPTIVMKGVPLGMKEVEVEGEGEPKENTDGDGNVRDGKVVEHAQGIVHPEIREGEPEKPSDSGNVSNGEHEKPADDHNDDLNVLQEN